LLRQLSLTSPKRPKVSHPRPDLWGYGEAETVIRAIATLNKPMAAPADKPFRIPLAARFGGRIG